MCPSRHSAGQPNAAQFIEASTLENLGKKRDLVMIVEVSLKEGRERFLPLLQMELNEPPAKPEFADIAIAWVRRRLAKTVRSVPLKPRVAVVDPQR